jgi:uroporphyrinogen decarboxylase
MRDLFLRACRREPVERTPMWMMRQAGRSLPEYREVRREVDFVTLCRTPELACKVTLQPIERLDVDAAILFSDILVPADCLGLDVDFQPGPVLANPLRTAADIEALEIRDPQESVPFVFETVRLLRRELEVPLIGFAGAPFTVAAYLVEGKGSKSFSWPLRLLWGEPKLAHRLFETLTEVTIAYLRGQVEAGAQAIQLFDSWAGLLDRKLFREFGLRYARRVLDALRPAGVPMIYFALNSGHLLEELGESGADVIGVDWRTELSVAAERVGGEFAYQGNLDPCALMAKPADIDARVAAIVEAGKKLPGHIFNLGHGVLPDTPVEHLLALVAAVRKHGAR